MTKLEKVKSMLKPGDVINNKGGQCYWYKPWTYVTKWGIQCTQKRLFGKESDYIPTHTVLYFSPDKIFSTTVPKTRWETLEERISQGFTVYRYDKKEYSDKHIDIMYKTASRMIGLPYDVGDLLNIMINEILGYDFVMKIKWFEFSRKWMVCSTSVRTIQENLRKTLEAEGDFSFKRLFNKLNPDKWSEEEIKKFKRTDVEMTTPAHYSNSLWFDGEFKRICGSEDFE